MRLWTIHPRYLDRIGLIALWREGLLAQKVLEGRTRGYTNHPQLMRFRRTPDPLLSIGTYLYHVFLEGLRRGYRFNKDKIKKYNKSLVNFIPVTSGQVKYEYHLLLYKLSLRNPRLMERLCEPKTIEVNPVFRIVSGPIEDWEKPKEVVLQFSAHPL